MINWFKKLYYILLLIEVKHLELHSGDNYDLAIRFFKYKIYIYGK